MQDQAWVKMSEGVKRRILADGEKVMMVEVMFEPGGIAALHHHVHEQVTHIVSGRVRFTVGNEDREMSAGETVLLLSNVPHGVTALEASVVIDAFSPPREDFRVQST